MTNGAAPLSRELADDLGWLEEHARARPDTAERAVPLRFAAAIVRNVVEPSLSKLPSSPLHVVVLGGAGTGKSTVANLLCGSVVAEANPQAGYTRHPIAYAAEPFASGWTSLNGFLGPLQRRLDTISSNVDEDVFQVRRIPVDDDTRLLDSFVVWDCPDMTTWAASEYAPRLLEVAALADVVAYVASDERYNDAVPTDYLRLLLASGKPVVVVLTKMKPDNIVALTDHFRTEVLSKLPRGRVAVMAVPHLTREELANPALAAKYRIPLVNQIAVLGESPEQLRKQSVKAAVSYLHSAQSELLAVARDDVHAMDEWAKLVASGQAEFDDRYRREFLTTAKFHRFDEALVKLIELLELPGAGKVVAQALHVVRTPYRLVKSFLGQVFATPNAPAIPEQPVLDASISAWTDRVRATALQHAKQHDLWNRVARGFEHGLGDELRERFRAGMREFQADQTDEIDRTARAIYEDLEKSPNTLATLRGTKLAADLGAIGLSLALAPFGMYDLLCVPLAAAMSQQLTEWIGAGYVESQREKARQRQLEMVSRHLSRPIATWLSQWPATGGTPYERMQQILKRVPAAVDQIDTAIKAQG